MGRGMGRGIHRRVSLLVDALTESQQDDVAVTVQLLMDAAVQLPFPHASGMDGSRHGHMRELRVQSGGSPLRIFYAFDPRRTALLLIGGEKTGDDRFYETISHRGSAL